MRARLPVFFVLVLWALNGRAASDPNNPNHQYQLSAELFGVGVLYSLSTSINLKNNFVFNANLTAVPLSSSSLDSTLAFVGSVGATQLFGIEKNFFEAGGGLNIVLSGALSGTGFNADYTQNSLIPFISMGYRYWPVEGFHFRATFYGLVARSFLPWFGLTFGYAFQ